MPDLIVLNKMATMHTGNQIIVYNIVCNIYAYGKNCD